MSIPDWHRFEGRRAIVTGAGRGIGRAVAERLAAEGARVACVDVDAESVEETVRIIRDRAESVPRAATDGGPAESVARPLDISDVVAIDAFVEQTAREFGAIDILVNVAGIVRSTPFLEVAPAEWDRIIDVNQRGTAFMMQAVARGMIAAIPDAVRAAGTADRCYGKIVNFSSVSGRRGRAYQLHYAASKAAVISITQSGALALAPYGINVNAICPSVVRTPMWEEANRGRAASEGVTPEESERRFVERIPLGRTGTPEEMAAAVAFLCSFEADFITGQTLNVDGGFEMD